MNHLTIYALTLRALLEDIHPTAPWLALSLGAWATVYAWRKLLPGLWLKLETLDKPLSVAIGALPSVIMTTAVGALTMGKDPWVLVGASLMGVGAPLLHHLLKALPISYQGQPAAKESLVTRRTMLLIVLFGLPGCVAQQSPAPKYTPEELLCIADAEAVKIKAFGACKPCSDAQLDVVMDERKRAGQACYLGAE
jgi:hypothetical protein